MSLALTDEQRRAVEARGPVCLRASAGSGKTAVLVERYLRLLSEGLRPDQILTVTFTRKAGQQLRDRILARLRESPEKLQDAVRKSPWIGTLHSFCGQVIRQWGPLLGRESAFEILENFDRARLVEEVCARWMRELPTDILEQAFDLWTPSDLQAIAQEALARPHPLRAILQEPHTLCSRGQILKPVLDPLLTLWTQTLAQARVCTFDDLEHDALRLLQEFEQTSEHYRAQIRAVLLDEFQDTSPAQWQIIQKIAAPDCSNLFVVGDPKQSIYRFRDADVHLFQQWNAAMREKGGESLELATCFRCQPELVAAINTYAGKLFEGTQLSENPMVSGRDPADAPALTRYPYPGETAALASAEEQKHVARVVKEWVANGKRPSEIALLFRNGDRLEAFAAALHAQGVPVACEPIAPLFSLYEVHDIAAYLRALTDPLDDFALTAFLRGPYAGFLPSDLYALQSVKAPSLFEKLHASGKLGWFVAVLEQGICRTQDALQALFQNTRTWPERSGALHRVLGGLAKATLLPDALDFLAAWEAQGLKVTAPLLSHQNEGVRLMTVHGSKGLEFRDVCLVDLLRRSPTRLPWLLWGKEPGLGIRFREQGEIQSNSVFDHLNEIAQREDAEEANRILYVALTRAKDSVHVFEPQNAKLVARGSWAERLKI